MEDCTHAQRNAEALQSFRDYIKEVTDDGSTLRQFKFNAMFDDAYRYLDGPWSYMRAIHSSMAYHTLASDGHDLFIYDSDAGRYVPGEDRVRKLLADRMELEWSPTRVNDVLTWFNDSSPRLWDTPPLERVNVLNGILDLESGDLEPQSEDFLSPVQINAAWDPEAECPAVDRFVQRVFPYDAHEVFYQLAGLFMVPNSRCQKAVLFLGSGASGSGKSVAIALLRAFLGPWNVSNVPLHDLTEGSLSLAELRGKLLNISADVPERDFDDTTVFKQIVDGQLAVLRAPRKYRNPIEFQPFTRLLASADRVPRSADNSLGYLRRWLAVPFDTTLDDTTLDPALLDKLTTPEELSGLLNRAVAEHRRLLEGGRLTESEKMAASKNKFDQASDSTRLFLEECVEESSPYDEINRTDLYNSYKDWCATNRLNPVGAHRLYTSVHDIFRIDTHNSHGRRLLKGIQLIPETPQTGAEGADRVQE